MAGALLASPDPGDAAEGEKALRELAPRSTPACLTLVTYLALREKADEALAIAESNVQSHSKEPAAHIAMGVAWGAKKDYAKAEAEFQEAIRVRRAWRRGPQDELCWNST